MSEVTSQDNVAHPLHVVVLAAGAGQRMHSDQPKVLQPLGGRPMLAYVLEAAHKLQPVGIHVVYGHGGDQVRAAFADWEGLALTWVRQEQQLGTGHAVAQALPELPDNAQVLVLYGDTPLIRYRDLVTLLGERSALKILSCEVDDPTGYGRIVRDEQSAVRAIVEHRDASAAQRAIREINTGVLSATAHDLRRWLDSLDTDNAQGEVLLTDVVGRAVQEGQTVAAAKAEDAVACLGANDRLQLAQLEQRVQDQRRLALLQAGVTLIVPQQVHIRGLVRAGRDVVLDINVILEGRVVLGAGVRIGAGCVLKDVELAAGTEVAPYSVLEGVTTTGPCHIGPFARLRPGTTLATGCKVGNFVEVKKSRLDEGAKASHLSYLGDTDVGAGVNIGAGTITCNYDGTHKHRTVIGDGAFIGSNTALVAPIAIGANTLVGAGSTLTQDTPADTLAVARGKQKNLPRRRKKPS